MTEPLAACEQFSKIVLQPPVAVLNKTSAAIGTSNWTDPDTMQVDCSTQPNVQIRKHTWITNRFLRSSKN